MATVMPTRLLQYTTPRVYTINDIKYIIIIPAIYIFFIYVLLYSITRPCYYSCQLVSRCKVYTHRIKRVNYKRMSNSTITSVAEL